MFSTESQKEVELLESVIDDLLRTKYQAFSLTDGSTYSKIVYSNDGTERVIFECWDYLLCQMIFQSVMHRVVLNDPDICYRAIYGDDVELQGYFKYKDCSLVWCWEVDLMRASLHFGNLKVDIE